MRDIYLRFYYYHLVDTSAGGQLVLEGITRLVVSASVLTWFIRYIFYWNLQFINNVIINKTMVLLQLNVISYVYNEIKWYTHTHIYIENTSYWGMLISFKYSIFKLRIHLKVLTYINLYILLIYSYILIVYND
jgi:hypothetical protein